MPSDRKIFDVLPDEKRAELGFRQWQWGSRIGTHGPGCYAWGPSHYECALEKIVGDDALLRQALDALEYHVEQTRPIGKTSIAIDAIRGRLSEREGEPA